MTDKNTSNIGLCVHDSHLTQKGEIRKRIYIGCSNGMHREARKQALKDFTANKKNINTIEKIATFNRALPVRCDFVERETILQREEYLDAVVSCINHVL